MSNKKNLAIIGILGGLLIFVIAFNYYFQNSIKQISIESESVDIEEEVVDDLIKKNQQVIDDALNGPSLFPKEISEKDYYSGDLEAPVKIIAYMDYSCGFSAVLAENLDTIVSEYEDKVVLAVRHFPMRTNTNGYKSSIAMECAGVQDKFWEMYKEVYTLIRSASSSDIYLNAAENIGMDINEFNECIREEEAKEKIVNESDDARTIGVIGTPTLYINNEVHTGAMPLDDFVDSQEFNREGLRSVIGRMVE